MGIINIVDTEVVAQTMRRLDLEVASTVDHPDERLLLTPGYRAILERGVEEGVREALGVIVQAYGMVQDSMGNPQEPREP